MDYIALESYVQHLIANNSPLLKVNAIEKEEDNFINRVVLRLQFKYEQQGSINRVCINF